MLEMEKTISSDKGLTYELSEYPLTVLDTNDRYCIEKERPKSPKASATNAA